MGQPNQHLEIHDRIDRDFSFHPAATEERRNEHESVRDNCKAMAHFLADLVPAGRELSTALTKLEEVMHWANAGLAKQD